MCDKLPVEVLQQIFLLLSPCTDLPNVVKVCKRWKEIGEATLLLRLSSSYSALCLESPLKWSSYNFDYLSDNKQRILAPTKRFGACLLLHNNAIYVFGGSTQDLTTFNDLWLYDLASCRWTRLIGQGDLPSPRAHAKGRFINNILYLYGGCFTVRHSFEMECYVNWLTDLNSYSLESQKWKNLKLFYVPSNVLRPPPDFGGQSGCFLPPSSTSPDLLVLFGGYCKRRRVCINKVVIVAPTLGQWCFAKIEGENEDENGIKLPAPSESDENLLLGRSAVWNNTDQSNCQSRTSQYPDSESCLSVRPLGRYGHSACPLNENQIVIVGGNTEPPQSLLSSVATDLHPHHQGRRFDEHRNAAIAEPNGEGRPSENSLPIINGTPACDIWILTRIPQETGKSWTTACWFWTKVVCSYSGSGCPPPDFYYSISLPVLSPLSGSGSSLFKSNYDINYPEQQQKEQLQKQSSLSCSTNSPSNTVTIDCGSSNVRLFVLSGATQTMIDEAGKQRRLRWRRELALDRACRSTAQRQVAANSVTNVGEGDAISVYSADSMPIATSPFASPFRGSSKQKLNALDSPQSLPNIDSSSTSQCNTGSEANFNLGVLYRHGGYPDTPASPISSSSDLKFPRVSQMPAPPGSLPYTLRANARRAKQLTALANLERRLFGPPAASISSNLQSPDDVAIDSNSSPIDVDSSGLSGLCPIVPSISPLSGSRAADFHEEPSANHSLSSPPHAPSNIRNISSPSSSNSLIFDPEELDPGCRLFRPLVPYSLHLTNLPLIDRHFSQSNSPFSRPPPTAVWTPAVRSTYLDLPGAPRELLGFSAILSHGAVFVFSGFSDDQTSADQSTLPRHQPSGGFRSPESLLSGSLRPSQSGQSWPANNLVSGSLAQGVRLSPITVRSKPQSAKLYVLQPRRLVDVLAFYH